MDDDELDQLADAFVVASRALVGIAVRSLAAAPVPVTVPQHRALVLLCTRGPQAVGEIAEQLGVNPSNATRLCDRLQRLHLVLRTPSMEDGRGVQVSISPEGRRLVEAVSAQRRAEVAAVLGRLPDAEARQAAAAVELFSEAALEGRDQDWSPSEL